MGKIEAKHNKLIKNLILDASYTILESGVITRKGKTLGFTKVTERKLRNKQYKYLRYKGKDLKIHRIVYCKFIGELKAGYVIHHKDDNSLNNNINNLEQVSQELNIYYRYSA